MRSPPRDIAPCKASDSAAAAHAGVAVCVVTGRRRAFSAGVDLDEMSRPGGSAALGVDFDPLLEGLARFPKPLVAAVNGLAVGFGATLLLHCDLVVVDERAEIRMPFVSLGTCAEAGSSWLLPRRVGPQQAAWLMLSGSPFGAEEAVAYRFRPRPGPGGSGRRRRIDGGGGLADTVSRRWWRTRPCLRAGVAEQVAEVLASGEGGHGGHGEEARPHRVVGAAVKAARGPGLAP